MKDRNIHGESNVWIQLKDRERSTDLMFMLGLLWSCVEEK